MFPDYMSNYLRFPTLEQMIEPYVANKPIRLLKVRNGQFAFSVYSPVTGLPTESVLLLGITGVGDPPLFDKVAQDDCIVDYGNGWAIGSVAFDVSDTYETVMSKVQQRVIELEKHRSPQPTSAQGANQ